MTLARITYLRSSCAAHTRNMAWTPLETIYRRQFVPHASPLNPLISPETPCPAPVTASAGDGVLDQLSRTYLVIDGHPTQKANRPPSGVRIVPLYVHHLLAIERLLPSALHEITQCLRVLYLHLLGQRVTSSHIDPCQNRSDPFNHIQGRKWHHTSDEVIS